MALDLRRGAKLAVDWRSAVTSGVSASARERYATMGVSGFEAPRLGRRDPRCATSPRFLGAKPADASRFAAVCGG